MGESPWRLRCPVAARLDPWVFMLNSSGVRLLSVIDRSGPTFLYIKSHGYPVFDKYPAVDRARTRRKV